MNSIEPFFNLYRVRGVLFLFMFAFGSSLFLAPKGGLITHIFLGPTLGRVVFALPHFLGAFVDGMVVAGTILLWSRIVDEGWFTPASRRVIITIIIVTLIALAVLVIDQFYTVPLP